MMKLFKVKGWEQQGLLKGYNKFLMFLSAKPQLVLHSLI